MKKNNNFKRVLNIALMILLSLTLIACTANNGNGTSNGNSTNGNSDLKDLIIYVNAGMSDDFQRVSADAVERTAGELEWQYELMDANANMNTQVEMIENAIVKNPKIIAINSIDPDAIAEACQDALDKGILVIEVGNQVNIELPIRQVHDIVDMGRTGMQMIVDEIGGEGEVLILAYEVRSWSVTEREKGWQEILDENPSITLADTQFGALDYSAMQTVGENMLQANPNAVAIYGDTGAGVVGAVNAAETLGRDVVITGADSDKEIMRFIYEDKVLASTAQDFGANAEMMVKNAVDYVDGKEYKTEVLTENLVITKDNVEELFEKFFGYPITEYIETGK